ncbi:MAG: hypothetical protein AB7P76_01285 [Candidatus Melainabacteria bacterium]
MTIATHTWACLGRILDPGALPGRPDWWVSHAANPIALPFNDNHVQVLLNFRDGDNRSGIAAVTLELGPQPAIVAIGAQPLLMPGEPGGFDEHGVSLGNVVTVGNQQYLYYVGWQRQTDIPWRCWLGLATRPAGEPDTPFTRYSKTPILGRSAVDPHSLSYPWVIHNADGWRMWYGSSTVWEPGTNRDPIRMEHILRHATSADGVHWQPEATPALNLDSQRPDIFAYSRPCVVRDGERTELWYSERGSDYQLALATRTREQPWQRAETTGLPEDREAWESEARCYAHVFTHGGQRWMLYNGNGYGRTGIGLARQPLTA